jgi:hypothetical protein
VEWAKIHRRALVQPVLRSEDEKGFVVLPKRWIVEKIFACFQRGDDSHRHDPNYGATIAQYLNSQTVSEGQAGYGRLRFPRTCRRRTGCGVVRVFRGRRFH